MNWFLKNRLRLPGTGKGVTLCYAARVGDLAALNRSDLSTFQRNDGNGFAVQRDEFNFVRPPVTVDMHDGADVSRGELVARQVGRKHYPVMFLYRGHVRIQARRWSRRSLHFLSQDIAQV